MARKTLQERMNSLRPYFKGIEMYNEALIVRVEYPSNWKAYPSDDGKVKVTPSETSPNETYYYASSNDSTYDSILDLIEETVKANQDILLKLELLREKTEELKEIFSTHTYEELSSLSFDFKKPRKMYAKRKKVAQDEIKGHPEQSYDTTANLTDSVQKETSEKEESNE